MALLSTLHMHTVVMPSIDFETEACMCLSASMHVIKHDRRQFNSLSRLLVERCNCASDR
jgi:hypothetical protein